MYRVQGTLREWVTRDEVRRFIAKKFKEFILTYENPNHDFEYLRQINEMVSGKNDRSSRPSTDKKGLIFILGLRNGCYLMRIILTYKNTLLLFVLHLNSFHVYYMQLINVASRLTTSSSSLSIQILPSGWQMRLSLSLRLWKKLLIKLYSTCILTTNKSTKKFMSE